MTMPGFAPEPLRVVCNSCGTEGWTFDYGHPDLAVECSCCPAAHDHGAAAAACPRAHEGGCAKGVPGCAVCRPVSIFGTAYLRVFEVTDLMDATDPAPQRDVRNAEVAP